ncbi:MAG: serine/threonine-protein kinase [Isosphaeraceae bacterium]|nr:serine/threonine-protein kinase [Isosphaeraceae bacterium]
MANTPPDLPLTVDHVRPDEEPPSDEALHNDPVSRQIQAMADAFRRGERPRAEEYLARHPQLAEDDAVRLIFEEACLRREEGEDSVSSEILDRFPQWRGKLELLFDCDQLLWTPPVADYPAVGEDLGDFRLQAELGRGVHGHTFLATQRSLADRPVVLKITPLGHKEHLSLARLQHMHIVPLYFEQVLPERYVRILGMPYLGGATLSQVLEDLRAVPTKQRKGRQLLDALDSHTAALPTEYPTTGPYRKYLAHASYLHAVCWLGACLADALQYAHDRGLVHMDVKPSNVLIASDGQPMLLDFHLARAPLEPGAAVTGRIGGTPGYLSPEQQRAIAALRQGESVMGTVDGRSDLFSLGLLLYEALGGDPGTGALAARRPLEDCNREVSPGLSDIIARCLAPDPDARYRDASDLALDLRRHLGDLPLRGVPNRSLSERWRKWRRREPNALARALVRLAVAAAVIGALLALAGHSRQQARQVEAALDEGRRHLANRQYPEAIRALRRGEALAPIAADGSLKSTLDTVLRQAVREQVEQELHSVVDLFRFRFGVTPPADDEARSLTARGHAIWDRRNLLATVTGEATDQTQSDFLDLATILADLHARDGSRAALGDAAHLLEEAREQFGPSPALVRDLRTYARRLGQDTSDSSDVPTPRTAWEHYDLGRSFLRSGDYALAEEEFRRSVTLRPGEFWPHFFEGVCAYRLGRYSNAAAAFSTCIALAPGTAACYYNRAKVHEALGQVEQALADDSRALELEPVFADAALNRGILWYRQGHPEQAAADFERARGATTSPTTLGLVHYNLALVHLARKDRPAAEASLKQAIEYGDAAARDLYHRLERP